jgi:hypothetical protein
MCDTRPWVKCSAVGGVSRFIFSLFSPDNWISSGIEDVEAVFRIPVLPNAVSQISSPKLEGMTLKRTRREMECGVRLSLRRQQPSVYHDAQNGRSPLSLPILLRYMFEMRSTDAHQVQYQFRFLCDTTISIYGRRQQTSDYTNRLSEPMRK